MAPPPSPLAPPLAPLLLLLLLLLAALPVSGDANSDDGRCGAACVFGEFPRQYPPWRRALGLAAVGVTLLLNGVGLPLLLLRRRSHFVAVRGVGLTIFFSLASLSGGLVEGLRDFVGEASVPCVATLGAMYLAFAVICGVHTTRFLRLYLLHLHQARATETLVRRRAPRVADAAAAAASPAKRSSAPAPSPEDTATLARLSSQQSRSELLRVGAATASDAETNAQPRLSAPSGSRAETGDDVRVLEHEHELDLEQGRERDLLAEGCESFGVVGEGPDAAHEAAASASAAVSAAAAASAVDGGGGGGNALLARLHAELDRRLSRVGLLSRKSQALLIALFMLPFGAAFVLRLCLAPLGGGGGGGVGGGGGNGCGGGGGAAGRTHAAALRCTRSSERTGICMRSRNKSTRICMNARWCTRTS